MHYLDLVDTYGPAWHARAACHPDNGHDPDLWFPESRDGQLRSRIAARAIAVCNTCPVRTQCLTDAIESGERFGVRGGVDLEAQAGRRKGADDAA